MCYNELFGLYAYLDAAAKVLKNFLHTSLGIAPIAAFSYGIVWGLLPLFSVIKAFPHINMWMLQTRRKWQSLLMTK